MTALTLEAARAGDERAFRALVEPYRRELHVHCYRMLGSIDDADDVLQEVFVAAWRGLSGFAERSSMRTWLYRIATTRCLNAIRDTARRPPVAPIAPFDPPRPSARTEVTWLQPYPDALLDELDPSERLVAREGVELAFITALQTLAPRQAAALVLCDVLGFSQAETGKMLDAPATAVKGLLQRARSARPRSAPAPLPVAEARLARAFAEAFTADDVEAIVTLLTHPRPAAVWTAMPTRR